MRNTDLDTTFSALADDVAGGVLVPPVDVIERRARRRTRIRLATAASLVVAVIGGSVGVAQLRDKGSGVVVAAQPTPTIPATPQVLIEHKQEDTATALLQWDEATLAAGDLAPGVGLRIEASLKLLITESRAAFLADATANPDPEGRPYAYYATISAEPSLPGLLTVLMDVSINMNGAHPMPSIVVRTYDLKDGAEVQAGQLVREDALPQLQAQVVERLQALASANGAELDPSMLGDGTAPKLDNYRLMWAAPDGLHVVFGAYQVAPYAFGQPEIVIPWSVASDWLPSGTPVRLP